ncbi:hypothetical protein [Brevundimonas sp. NPDC058933]|uniref:hypothetical protein n=1 Tax=Brevundimonas sp. NPDC058933 TaxID=3346673 RepID=UPI003BEF2FEC
MSIRIDLSDLTSNLNLEAELNEIAVQEVVKKLALDLQAGLMLATPVDTGQARNGWQIAEAGDLTAVENMVPYIGVLNDGHSQQAPAGFVENVIDDVTKRPTK